MLANFSVPFLKAEMFLVGSALVGFYFFLVRPGKNNTFFRNFFSVLNQLPLFNRILLGFFTLSTAIPNRWWVNNSTNGFKLFVLTTLILLLGYKFHFIFFCYFMYLAMLIESITFGLFYEHSSSVRSIVNRILFGNVSHEFAGEYFSFFWGNMWKGGTKKVMPIIVAGAAVTGPVVVQRNHEIMERTKYGQEQCRLYTETTGEKFPSVDALEKSQQTQEAQWVVKNGVITKIEAITFLS
jgi:hypothetical protein